MAKVDDALNMIAGVAGIDESGRAFSPFIERGSDQIPQVVPMPTAEQMRGLSTAELSSVAQRYGWVDTWENRMAVNEGFLRDFNIVNGDPRYAVAMQRLEGNHARALLGHTRRMAQRFEIMSAIDGNLNQELIYINESAEPCDECEPLGGTTGTYRELAEAGNLPGDRCLGQSNCLCTAMAID